MSEHLALALVVTALYASECVVWARHGAVLVTAPFLFGPRMRVLSRALGNARGAFTLLNPLPPFGRVYVVEPWPFSVGADGVVAARSFSLASEPRTQQTTRCLRWREIEQVTVEDKGVRVNGAPFADTSSARHARSAAAVLTQLAAETSEKERLKRLDELIAAHVDPEVARAAVRRHARWSAPLLVGATGAFCALFVVAPRVIHDHGLQHWPLLVGGVYAWVLVCVVSMALAHRALLPEARADRWLQVLLMIPAPTMAMRGNDKLGRHLLAGSHPVAAALGVLSGNERSSVTGRALRDLAHPRALATSDAFALAVERDFRARVLAAAKDAARRAGVDVDACFAPPAPRGGQRAWCPRCRLTFRQGGACSDCGVTLAALEA